MAADDVMLVFTNPVVDREDEFNEWYDTTHVPDVLAVPGVVAAQRYTLAEVRTSELGDLAAILPPPEHRYLALYRLERDANDVMKDFLARVTSGEMLLSDSLDLASIRLSVWSPIGRERTADT